MSATFEIAGLGALGDGIAETETGPVFIRYALPGETVTAARVKDRADLVAILSASPQRFRRPAVTSQPAAAARSSIWNKPPISTGNARRSCRRCEPAASRQKSATSCPARRETRRRVTFSARKTERGVLLGFNRAHSNEIVDIAECPISLPEIVASLDRLRVLAGMIAATPQPFHMTVTATASGLDIAAEGAGKLGEGRRRAVSEFVVREGFARLSVDGEISSSRRSRPSCLATSPCRCHRAPSCRPPPLPSRPWPIWCFPISRARKRSPTSSPAAAALRCGLRRSPRCMRSRATPPRSQRSTAASARHPGLKRVTTEKRDLFRRPLTFKELNAFDGIVFDPPRAGAEDQSKQIARSDVPFVAAVSCNPGTLARDLAILVAGGYRVKSVTPVDQFLWSPHVEAVALLEKPRRRR